MRKFRKPIRIIGVITISALLINHYVWYSKDLNTRTQQYDELLLTVNAESKTSEFIEICSMNTFKSWMDFRSITYVPSKQYYIQSKSITNDDGVRELNGRLTIAMAEQYGPVGTEYDITFEDGQTIEAVIGDIKANTGCTHPDGSLIEFIVDKNLISKDIRIGGNVDELYQGSIILMVRNE